MKYEIAYISKSGNTKKLAEEISLRMPRHKVTITDLSASDLSKKSDFYLIGFGVNNGAIPIRIMNSLEELSGKKIMFFVTCGMEPIAEYRDFVERRLEPFVADDCEYLGLFMCQGKFPNEVLKWASERLDENLDDKVALKILEDSELSANHPNETDYDNAYNFVKEHIGL